MPISIGGGVGGGGFTLGPEQNVFTGADRTAAETARDTYAGNNPSWLTSYNDDTNLNIRLEYTDSGEPVVVFQVRNTAGDAWLDNESIRGVRGAPGEGQLDQNIPLGTVLIASDDSGDVVAGASSVMEMTDRVRSTKQFDARDSLAYAMGNYLIYNGGNGILIEELTSQRTFFPVNYELSSTGSSIPTYEMFAATATTPSVADTSEEFSGATHSFTITNPNRGNAEQYTVRVPADAVAVTDCNITIRANGVPLDRPALFDYKNSTGGTGFTLVAGDGSNPTDSVITLPRPAFFQEGLDIDITVTAGSGQTLRLLGQTLPVPGFGNQEIPYLEVVGQASDEISVGEHPVTLRRDMPSEEDATALARASLNGNSAIWIVGNDQLASSNRADATIVAQRAGFFDLFGNEIPTTPVAANTLQLRSGTDVRVFSANDYRIVNSPVFESDISSARIDVQDEGTEIVADAAAINFTGDGVTVTNVGGIPTVTIAGGGGTPPPQPGPSDFRYGLSQTSDASTVDTTSFTDVTSPTDPQTVSTGNTSAGDYFWIFSANSHDITSITDTVLQQIVYQDPADPNNPNIFTKTDDAQTISGTVFDAYRVGPLNAGVNEEYVVRFS